ncbi:MAG TPA: DinB family protein [Catalimonadaceae bacterium]|mgnify:CR=1 FL=1|nr:DinB family protein [Catalimonadaceae bacterium]HPI12164.1 DinB family protein [Catalimonadaceae bacterium]
MKTAAQIAKHLREVHFGGNWTWSNMKENVAELSWVEATRKPTPFHSVAELVFHTNYFVRVAISALRGEKIDAHDKFSFDLPPIASESDWENLKNQAFADAEMLATLIEVLPDERLGATFILEKYGNHFRNLHGIIEHTHYHLGQIAMVKKLVSGNENPTSSTNP